MRLVFHTQLARKQEKPRQVAEEKRCQEKWEECWLLGTRSEYPWPYRLGSETVALLLFISLVRCVLAERQKPGPVDE